MLYEWRGIANRLADYWRAYLAAFSARRTIGAHRALGAHLIGVLPITTSLRTIGVVANPME